MKQYEAVIETIEKLGWIATLWKINNYIFEIKDCEWKTKTPFASIRRIVQLHKDIYKIKPWLYWLVKYKKQNENKWFIEITEQNKDSKDLMEFTHSYYQWLLVEIWNLEKFETFVPAQDRNKFFIDKKLWEITTVPKMYEFWYEKFIKKAQTIDTIYFNNNKMPSHLYEIEHSTDIQNSLLKFCELEDFNAKFFIVADIMREKEYNLKLWYNAFDKIKNRVKFFPYDKLVEKHTNTYNYHTSNIYTI